MARRRHTNRTSFYGKMKVMFWSAASFNAFLAMLIGRVRGQENAERMLFFAVLSLLGVVVEIIDSRPAQNDLGTMIGIALVHLVFFGLALLTTFSWMLVAVFVLENVLIWRYFIRYHPHPL